MEAARASGAAINPRAAASAGGAVYYDKRIAIEQGEAIVIEYDEPIVIEDDEPAVGTKVKPIVIEADE